MGAEGEHRPGVQRGSPQDAGEIGNKVEAAICSRGRNLSGKAAVNNPRIINFTNLSNLRASLSFIITLGIVVAKNLQNCCSIINLNK